MSLHSLQTLNHPIESWSFANAAARQTAAGLTFGATDVGRIAFQSDNSSYYRLINNSPLAWDSIGAVVNFSNAAQSPGAGTRTYLAGSALPSGKLQVGTCYNWLIGMSKTGAGTGNTAWDVAFGTAGTTADTARCSITGPAETAVIDAAQVQITATVRSISATGLVAASFNVASNLVTTGFKNLVGSVVSGTFDTTVAALIAGICITPGAADVITINSVLALGYNIG